MTDGKPKPRFGSCRFGLGNAAAQQKELDSCIFSTVDLVLVQPSERADRAGDYFNFTPSIVILQPKVLLNEPRTRP